MKDEQPSLFSMSDLDPLMTERELLRQPLKPHVAGLTAASIATCEVLNLHYGTTEWDKATDEAKLIYRRIASVAIDAYRQTVFMARK